MNERLREFERESKLEIFGLGARREIWEKALAKYAELIVEECFKAAMIESNGHMNPIDLMKRMKERAGVEEPQGWVCSKCGIDRIREVCPKGHMAAVTGDCPMIAEAQ